MSGRAKLDPELTQHTVPVLRWFSLDRRRFLRLFGGGLLVAAASPDATAFAQESGRARQPQELPKDLAAWLHIDKDGKVTVFTGKVEVGQNIRTSLAQQVAEELRLGVDAIRMVMGDTDLVPWDAGTFGSRTTPTMGPQLRAVAATARETLLDLAAARWGVSRDSLAAANGKITDAASKRSISYGELTRGEKLVKTLPGDGATVPVTPASEWKIAGSQVPKVDGRDFVTGVHRYASDMTRPGMLYGKVLRAPAFETKLTSLETGKAQAIPGVKVVRDGEFAGVVAPDSHTAERALEALAATWTEPPAQPSNKTIFEYFKRNADAGEDRSEPRVKGSIEEGLKAAEVTLTQSYTVEYIAHAPLEPRAALAEWAPGGDRLTVWTGTQRPFAVREELATAFRIPSEKVRVLVPDTGSAYGGKHTGDAAVEAARLSKAAGKPVKVVWTREEEFEWAYLRPGGLIEVRSGARKDGSLVAWEFHNYNSGPAGIGTPYDVANQKIQYHPVKSPLRQGSYRALAATANHFARESHMDELAHALGMDPFAFRMKNLSDARLKAVFEAAADKFGWGKRKPATGSGRGFGIAGGVEKGGYIALCAEVEVEGGKPGGRVQIRRVVAAFECGAIVNPGGLRNQVEGAIVQGIGGALFEAIRFRTGGCGILTSPNTASRAFPMSHKSTWCSSTARTFRRRERGRLRSSESRRRWREGSSRRRGSGGAGCPWRDWRRSSAGEPAAHPCGDLGRHSILVGAADVPERDVGTLLHGVDEASAAQADGRDEDGRGVEEGRHRFDESPRKRLHLPDLVDEDDVAAAPRELIRRDAVERGQIDAVLADSVWRTDLHVGENGARAVEGFDAKADALPLFADLLGREPADLQVGKLPGRAAQCCRLPDARRPGQKKRVRFPLHHGRYTLPMAKEGSKKQRVRDAVWSHFEESGEALFPGARGRIPNFRGAAAAADRLAATPEWRRAKVVKCNPDSPQRPVRLRALREGKIVYVAVPRLAESKCFWRLDPSRLDPRDLPAAATIRGASRFGRPARPRELPHVDLIVAGSVAVNRKGVRVGKGGGYSDLEYAIGREVGAIDAKTAVATTVHPLQVVAADLPATAHDFFLDLIVTPEEAIRPPRRRQQPKGILPDHLSEEKRRAIPALRELNVR